MSWPSDGEPRFKVASIRGGTIGVTPDTLGRDKLTSVSFYVLDRAVCHRVVRHISVYSGVTSARAGRDAIEHMCARLNGESDPL